MKILRVLTTGQGHEAAKVKQEGRPKVVAVARTEVFETAGELLNQGRGSESLKEVNYFR